MTATVPTFERWAKIASPRKLRLFAVACARLTPDLELPEASRRAVEMAERFADGETTREELRSVFDAAEVETGRTRGIDIACLCAAGDLSEASFSALTEWLANTTTCPTAALLACIAGPCERACCDERYHHPDSTYSPKACPTCHGSDFFAALLPTPCGKCESGWVTFNRGQSGMVCPDCQRILAWNDGTPRRMAERIYESRDFSLMPILADALMDVGVHADSEIVRHCQIRDISFRGPLVDPAIHAKGCWVVDLLTGRS